MTASTIKSRVFKNWATSIFGALLMVAALTMYIMNRIPQYELNFSNLELIMVSLLGWVFLMSKNSLLEGLFLNIFKVKSKE